MSDSLLREADRYVSAPVGVSGTRAAIALATLAAATLVASLDRQVLVLVVEPLKRDLALSDVQIGLLQGLGPGLFAAIAAFPLAWLADRCDRTRLLAACTALAAVFTFARAYSSDLSTLLLTTVAGSAADAVLAPVIYSLIPDLFRGSARTTANLVFFGTVVIGSGVSLAAGATVLAMADHARVLLPEAIATGSAWRVAFACVAMAGVAMALLTLLIGRIPRFTTVEEQRVPARLTAYARANAATLAGVYLAGGVCNFAAFGCGAWLVAALVRGLQVPAPSAGAAIGAAYTIGSLAGIAAALSLAPLWRRRAGPCAAIRALQTCMLAAVVPTALLPLASVPWHAYSLAGVQMAAVVAGSAMAPGMFQDMAPAHLRARLMALNAIVYVVVGASSPMLIGWWSDALGPDPRALLQVVAAVAGAGFLLAAVLYRATETPFRRTLARLGHAG